MKSRSPNLSEKNLYKKEIKFTIVVYGFLKLGHVQDFPAIYVHSIIHLEGQIMYL